MNVFAPTQALPLPLDTRLSVTLTISDWNMIKKQLAERPYYLVAPILSELRAQIALAAYAQDAPQWRK
jgi:hypothetical protein